MLIISKSIKLSEGDIESLKSDGEIVNYNVITAAGTDEVDIAIEQNENCIKACNCVEKREVLQNKIKELIKLDHEINYLAKEINNCKYCK